MYRYKTKQRKHKPLYKKFLRLRVNAQDKKRLNLLKFKRKKWEPLISFIERKSKRRKNKFKAFDINRFGLPWYYNPFKKRFRNILFNKQKVSLFYGSIPGKQFKKHNKLLIKSKKNLPYLFNNYILILNFFEKKIATILYRAKFVISVRSAKQLILHGHIMVNGKTITNYLYKLDAGDIISINKKFHEKIGKTILNSKFWPVPPKYLCINYKTLEICLINSKPNDNLALNYPFKINTYLLSRKF